MPTACAPSRTHTHTLCSAGGAFYFRLRISDLQALAELMAALEALPHVTNIMRDSMEAMLNDSPESFWSNAVVD